eukprot:gene13699-16142_t
MSSTNSTTIITTSTSGNGPMITTPPPVNPKYGLPKRNIIYQRLHSKKFFDSADWVMNGNNPIDVPNETPLINPAFNTPTIAMH